MTLVECTVVNPLERIALRNIVEKKERVGRAIQPIDYYERIVPRNRYVSCREMLSRPHKSEA